MKFQFSIILVALMAVTFFSCKDEDVVAKNRELIVGTWKADATVISNCNDATKNLDLTFGENGACGVDADSGANYCITQDAVFTETRYTITANIVATLLGVEVLNQTDTTTGTYTIDSETEITFKEDGQPETKGTYTVSASKLHVSLDADSEGCETVIDATKQ